ncbi:MAG: DEAD/DEAH box helicase, partial [Thermodesulfovibrionales bacterium]
MKILYVRNMTGIVVESTEERERLIASLTLLNKFDGEKLELFKQNSLFELEIPIAYTAYPVEFNPRWENIDVTFRGNLRAEQSKLVESYLNHIATTNGSIIQSPTGWGKTILSINILTRLKLKSLVIVPTDYLMEQWQRELKRFSNLTDADIGICRGDVCQYENKKVVVGMIHSLAKEARYPEDFYNCFGLCIVDEVHRLSAPTFSQSLPQFWTKYRLGLSATARRKDGMENVFFYHIGKICNQEIKQPIKPKVVVMEYYNPESHHGNCVWGGKLSLGRYYNKIAYLEHRNNYIAQILTKLYKKGEDILVLSDRLRQLDILRDYLIQAKIPKEDIGI